MTKNQIPGVTIIATDQYLDLINRMESLHSLVLKATEELKASKSPWMKTTEVAAHLRKHKNWVLANKEELGYSKRGGEILFKRSAVDAYVEAGYIKPKLPF